MEVKRPPVHWSEVPSDSRTYYCVNCGRSDETVRFVTYPYVFSLIFISYRRAFSGIWCARHRLWYGSLACLITLIFGWFGIPWGLIFTPVALFHLASGGGKDEEANARILSAVGEEKLSKGDRDVAIRCFEQSLRYEDQPDTRERLKALYTYRSSSDENKARIIWQFAIILAIPLFLHLAGILVGLVDFGISIMIGNLIGEEGNIFTFILAWIPLIFFLFIGIIILRKTLEWITRVTKIASIGLVNLLIFFNSIVFVYAVAVGVVVGNLIQYMYYGIYFNSSGEILSTIASLITRGGIYFLSNAIASGELWGILYMIILPGFAIFSLIVNIPLMADVVKWQNVLREVSSRGTSIEKSPSFGAWAAITVLAFGFMFLYLLFPQQKQVDFLEASDHYFNGMFYLDSEKYGQAVTEFEQASQLRPDNPDARLGLGYAYFYQEDYEPAAEIFSEALEINPESFDLLEAAGWSNYHLGNTEVAKEYFETALKIIPDSAWSHLGLGWIFLYSNAEASIDAFELVLSQYPDSADASLGLGIAYFSIQDNDRAIEELKIAAQDEYSMPFAYLIMGNVYFDDRQYGLALDAYTNAINLVPDYYDAYIGRAQVYFENDALEQAISNINAAIKLQPENVVGYIYLGSIYSRQGNHNKGLNEIEKALRYDLDNQTSHALRAILLYRTGQDEAAEAELELAHSNEALDYQSAFIVAEALSTMHRHLDAINYLEESVNLIPGSLDVDHYISLARNYSALGNFDEAHSALDTALDQDPDNPDIFIARALVYTDQENLAAAEEQYKRALSLDPETDAAHVGLSFVYFQMEKLDEAAQEAEIAIQENKYSWRGYQRLAFAYHALGHLVDAFNAARQAVRLDPTADSPHYILAICYMDMGRNAEAVQEFEKFLHYYYDRPFVRNYKLLAEEYIETLNLMP